MEDDLLEAKLQRLIEEAIRLGLESKVQPFLNFGSVENRIAMLQMVNGEASRREEAERGLQEAEKRRQEAVRGLQEAERRRNEERSRRQEAERERQEAERRRNEERSRRQEAERERQEAERRRNEERSRRQEAERGLQEETRLRKAAERKLKEMKRLLKEAQKHSEEAMKFAFCNTYGVKSPFKPPPPLSLNKAVIPSCCGHSRTISIVNELGDKVTQKLKIPEAIFKESKGGMWLDPSKVTIPTKDASGAQIYSSLGLNYIAQIKGPLEYANEFGVQFYCQVMIGDALGALGLTGDFVKSHLEISIYMMKPDIVLVLKIEGRILFVVEVKSPEHGTHNVFNNRSVGGQIWSYLNCMKSSGVRVPMGAIMTYHKIAIVSLDDYSKDEQHLLKVVRTKDILSTGKAITIPPIVEQVKCEERKKSPTKIVRHFTQENSEYTEEVTSDFNVGSNGTIAHESGNDEFQGLPMERTVYSSKVYEGGDVFPCLLQALHLAYQYAGESSDTSKILRINNGEAMGNRLVFKVGPFSFDWVTIEKNVRAKVNNKIPPDRTNYYFILGQLGVGSKASTYLGSSGSGQVCAIKDYFLAPSSAATEEQRNSDDEDECEKLFKKANEEHRRWASIYEDRFETRVKYLGGKPSFIMPYGYEVSRSEDRWQYLPEIRDELLRFAGLGFVYESKDLRWRHVLLDCNNKVFLCDLESLVELQGDVNDAVYEQLFTLLLPCISDINLQDALQWVNNAPEEVTSFICQSPAIRCFLRDTALSLSGTLASLFPPQVSIENFTHQAKIILAMIGYFKTTMGND
ncbi:hypothetical protein IV203_025240 [Nitzschia inconspicua]|uniref:Uncharacterized protein n=1 Tax=Nitzschia inconspicua TaxID=303405 RepID=A0A9K3LHU5_9STRA|nr:hypothetical protein IV203_024752 [Nitzschia inconspicua]KAG7339720.1 hypothetical protein IV203_024759 [Nitzschia inconspicua]KAG7362347.1 hypothetical protein IV203_025231 [Nitzschia inconspicua]KAG7362356.1 hypothetical protein IV203_025240 [Nitzschia inconspicua]